MGVRKVLAIVVSTGLVLFLPIASAIAMPAVFVALAIIDRKATDIPKSYRKWWVVGITTIAVLGPGDCRPVHKPETPSDSHPLWRRRHDCQRRLLVPDR